MKLTHVLMLAAVVASVAGCKSTLDDRWRADMETTLEDAHFRPIYRVLKDKGIVSGSAESSFILWGLLGEGPDTFANEIGGPITLTPGIKEAAFADACRKANCQILLAPRFTVTKERGILWFAGSDKAVVEGVPAVLEGAEEIPLEKWVEYQVKIAPTMGPQLPKLPGAPGMAFWPF